MNGGVGAGGGGAKNKQIVGLINHNMSVNLGQRGPDHSLLIEESAANNKINSNSFMMRQGGSVAGIENLVPLNKISSSLGGGGG